MGTPVGSQICLACGLCCQGVLFSRAYLREHETELAEHMGAIVDVDDVKHYFRLPAPCYIDGKCGRYTEKRPKVCRKFFCCLLKDVMKGNVTKEEALECVNKVKKLVALILKENDLLDSTMALSPQIREVLEKQENDIAWRRQHAKLILDICTFNVLKERHFVEKKDALKDSKA